MGRGEFIIIKKKIKVSCCSHCVKVAGARAAETCHFVCSLSSRAREPARPRRGRAGRDAGSALPPAGLGLQRPERRRRPQRVRPSPSPGARLGAQDSRRRDRNK